ncbi:MAG: COX15/CtaA family protein [Microbacteriaceae bacterium]|nr:COX15/CtaA family protein [Microbacteriaceae bacterium]
MAIHRIDSKAPAAAHLAAWLNLVGNTLIIGTGGAVRLTGSGLGCPNWPTCTPESWIPTEELSYHSLIEFGNRLMSPVLVILAIFAFVVTWKLRHDRKDSFVHALLIGFGVLLYTVGGITVGFPV